MDAEPRRFAARLWRGFVLLLVALRAAARLAWSVARRPVIFTLNVVAALIVLFEEWGWRPLADLVGRLAKYRPWAAFERWIASLPPYPSLLVFTLPSTLLFPLKFVALWLLARGMVIAAGALFIGAKIVSTALVARIFLLTKPALMRIGWFASAYDRFMIWKEHLFDIIRASTVWRYGRVVKARVRPILRKLADAERPTIEAARAWMQARAAQFSGRRE